MCNWKFPTRVTLVAWIALLFTPLAVAEEGFDEEDRVWTVAVLADLNGPYGSMEYNAHVHAATAWIRDELRPDLVISAGDMVAGQREGLDYSAMWQAFHTTVTDELAQSGIPLAVSPGNHDASEQPRFWRERVEFARQWERRRPRLDFVDDAFYPFYYAFQVGPALFISMDGTGVGDLDEAQRSWIDETLERHAHLPVKVLYSHIPQYPVAEGRQREGVGDEEFGEILRRHDVDLMVSGHHHAYYPARRDGTVFLHASALGDGVRFLLGEEIRRPRNVSVVEFNSEGIVDIRAYESPRFDQLVEIEDLPESLEYDGQKIWRMDVVDGEGDGAEEPES